MKIADSLSRGVYKLYGISGAKMVRQLTVELRRNHAASIHTILRNQLEVELHGLVRASLLNDLGPRHLGN